MNNKKICEEIRTSAIIAMENMKNASTLEDLRFYYGKALAYIDSLNCFLDEDIETFDVNDLYQVICEKFTKQEETFEFSVGDVNLANGIYVKNYRAPIKYKEKIDQILENYKKCFTSESNKANTKELEKYATLINP